MMPSFRGGGAERVFIDLAIGLQLEGLRVKLVVLSEEGPYRTSVPENIKVEVLGSGKVSKDAFKLYRYMKSTESDVILSCLTHLNIVAAITWLFAGRRSKLIVTEHNQFSLEKASMPSFVKLLMKMATKFSYAFVDKVVAVSEGVSHDLVNHVGIDKDNINVIYNPIDINIFQNHR